MIFKTIDDLWKMSKILANKFQKYLLSKKLLKFSEMLQKTVTVTENIMIMHSINFKHIKKRKKKCLAIF